MLTPETATQPPDTSSAGRALHVMGMQKLMRLMTEGFTQKLGIELLDTGVFMRQAKLPVTVVLIQAPGTRGADFIGYPVGWPPPPAQPPGQAMTSIKS